MALLNIAPKGDLGFVVVPVSGRMRSGDVERRVSGVTISLLICPIEPHPVLQQPGPARSLRQGGAQGRIPDGGRPHWSLRVGKENLCIC